MINAILRFYGVDPAVAWLLTFAAAFIIASAIYLIWLRHEERKAEQAKRQRSELDAALALSHNLEKRGPSGFSQRKDVA